MDSFGWFFDLNGDGKVDALEDAVGVATLLAALDDDGEERFDEDELCEDDEDDFDEDELCEDDDEDDFDEEDV